MYGYWCFEFGYYFVVFQKLRFACVSFIFFKCSVAKNPTAISATFSLSITFSRLKSLADARKQYLSANSHYNSNNKTRFLSLSPRYQTEYYPDNIVNSCRGM